MALTTDRTYSCVFSNGERVSSADSDQSLLSALQNRATAYSPPSIAALPPPPRPPEPRCRLLPALQSGAAASSPLSRVAMPPPPALKSRAAASSSPPFRAAHATASFQHSPTCSPERTIHPLLCHIRYTNYVMSFNSINVRLSAQCHLTG